MSAKLLSPKEIIGIDISSGMLEIGREKVAKLGFARLYPIAIGR